MLASAHLSCDEADADARVLPPGAHATSETMSCPVRMATWFMDRVSHTLTEPSLEPEASCVLLGANAVVVTWSECPPRAAICSRLVRFHTTTAFSSGDC